jgi:hypothetical protein
MFLAVVLDAWCNDPLSFGRGPKDADAAVAVQGKGIVVKGLRKTFKVRAAPAPGPLSRKRLAFSIQAPDPGVHDNDIPSAGLVF